MPKEKLKHITTVEVKRAVVPDPGPAIPSPRGPMIGEAKFTDKDVIGLYATKEDLAALRAVIDARMAAVEPGADGAWRTLPDGSKIRSTTVLAGCPSCGRWTWVESKLMPTTCVCYGARTKGVKMRLATAEETAAWYIREEATLAKLKADAPKQAAEVGDYNRRRWADGKFDPRQK